jgi:hypothetical protein
MMMQLLDHFQYSTTSCATLKKCIILVGEHGGTTLGHHGTYCCGSQQIMVNSIENLRKGHNVITYLRLKKRQTEKITNKIFQNLTPLHV